MTSTGITAKATTDDTAIELLSISGGGNQPVRVTIINTGTAAGFVSIDGGTTWNYMPAGNDAGPASRTFVITDRAAAIVAQAKRIPSGSNMSGLYADAQ